MTTPDTKTAKTYTGFVSRILKAKKDNEQARLDVYGMCREFDDSKCWVSQFRTFEQVMRDVLHLSTATYRDYRQAVGLYSPELVEAVGLVASCALAKVLQNPTAKAAIETNPELPKTLYKNFSERLEAWKSESGSSTSPSDRHITTFVQQVALSLHLVAPIRAAGESLATRHQKAVDVLMAILDIDPSAKARSAVEIARNGLLAIGVDLSEPAKARAA